MGADEVREYLQESLDVLHVGGDEYRLRNCLFCQRHRTMKVNVRKLRFICHHGNCGVAGNIVRLIELIEGCTRTEAQRILGDLVAGTSSRSHSLSELEPDASEPDDGKDRNIGLPDEYEPCWNGEKWTVPGYLKERGVKNAEIAKWELGFCRSGDYAGRVIVPVRCDGKSTFVARDITGTASNKYDTPAGNAQDEMLFGFDQVEVGGPVVAVEGVFDAMRLWRYGHPAVAYFGSEPTPSQIDLLERLDPRPLILMPDGDDPRAQAKVAELAFGLTSRFRDVRLAVLDGVDPGEASKEVLEAAIDAAKRPSSAADHLRFITDNIHDPYT